MARNPRPVIGGVDTHSATHHAAVIDTRGRLLGDAQFPATPAGYAAMLAWMRGKGRVESVGVEGTGAYGAGLARYLHQCQVTVLEVPRPDRRLRRQRGKSDLRDRPRRLANTDQIRCREHSRATRFSPAFSPAAARSSAMNRYPNAGSSWWMSMAALIRCASSQSRWQTGFFFHL